jgi:hypothetical protein
MKIPNFASLYHSGSAYCCRLPQSARNLPDSFTSSTCFRISLRAPSYFALAFTHCRSISAAGSLEVGASACG